MSSSWTDSHSVFSAMSSEKVATFVRRSNHGPFDSSTAFECLWLSRRGQQIAVACARHRFLYHEQVDEVVQDSAATQLQALLTHDGAPFLVSWEAWTFYMSRHVALAFTTKLQRERERRKKDAEVPQRPQRAEPDWAANLDLKMALETLTDDQRELVNRWAAGWKTDELAARWDTTPQTINRRLRSIWRQLRDLLDEPAVLPDPDDVEA